VIGCSVSLAPIGFLAGRYLAPKREITTWAPELNRGNSEIVFGTGTLDVFKIESVMVDRVGPRDCVYVHIKSVTPLTPLGGSFTEPARSVDLSRLFGHSKNDIEHLVKSYKCKIVDSHLEFQDEKLHLNKIIPLRR
jgi:hypothetical protein